MLILSMLFCTFSTTQTREHDSPLRLFMLHNPKIQVVGDAKLNVPVWLLRM
jgi:hypothetical protein